jgi:hypothetical protein
MSIFGFLKKNKKQKHRDYTFDPHKVLSYIGEKIIIEDRDDGIYVFWKDDILRYIDVRCIGIYIGDTEKKKYLIVTAVQKLSLFRLDEAHIFRFRRADINEVEYLRNLLGFEIIYKGYDELDSFKPKW